MAGVLCRARISNAACVRAVLIPACGVGMWLQGSQSAAALEPRAVGGTPQRSGADRLASEPPNTIEEGPLASGLAVGPTGPTGFATAYATSYSCAFEFEPCHLAEFSGVSCAEASCTAVGTAVGNTTLAEGWGGTKWTIEPTPAPGDATWSTLASVSCTAATACLAVGSYYGSSGELPLAELWNGSSWTIRPPPTPSEGSNDVLSYVQCATAKACMAVGSYYSAATSQTVPLAELWDGSAWTIESAPLPSGADNGALTGVSCPEKAACTAVGAYSTPSTGQTPLAESWDGSTWSIHPAASPTGSTGSALNAVWCESAKSCSAVGSSASSSGGSLTLAESWDGTSWTIEPTPNPNASSYNGFTNLSCAPEGKPCTAVGFSGNTTLTESWDGMTWGELPITPEPAGSTQSSFSDVSCTAPNVCTAVGQYLDSTEGPTGAYLTLAERWNGTSWTIQLTANPALAGTDAATNITSSTADLHGTVYPGGAATTCYFEYGTTSAYGSTMPCAQTTGPGAAPVSVSANLAGLSPNTTYYFNLVATNAGGGMSYTPGPASFTTLATSGSGGPPPPPCASSEPAICSVTPDHGPWSGGTTVTIKGVGFQNGDRICWYTGTPAFAIQEGCDSSTMVTSATELTARTPAISSPNDAGTRYLGIRRCCSGLSLDNFVSDVPYSYTADFTNCPGPGTALATHFPVVPVASLGSLLKSYSVEYGALALTWKAVSPDPSVVCSVQSSVGALPVYVEFHPGLLPLPPVIPTGIPILAALSVTSARLDYFPVNQTRPPVCNWQTVTHDCSLNGDGLVMVRWHTDGFDEEDPILHTSFYNSGPLTYYVNASDTNIAGSLQSLEVYIHKTLIAHLPLVEKIAVIQEPPADLEVRDALGRVTGFERGGSVSRGIPHAAYVSGSHGFSAVILPQPDGGPYSVTVSGKPKTPYNLSMSAFEVSVADALQAVNVMRAGKLNSGGRIDFTFAPAVSATPRIGRHRAAIARARGRRRIRVKYALPRAVDSNGRAVPVVCVPRSGSLFRVGKTRVTCVAGATVGPVAESAFFVSVRR